MNLPESRTSIILKTGMEYFPDARIDAHGTYFYTPDDNDDKTREDYSYKDAEGSINQPTFRPYAQIGIIFPIGS